MSDTPLYKPVMAVLPGKALQLGQKESMCFRRHYRIISHAALSLQGYKRCQGYRPPRVIMRRMFIV